MFTDGGGGRFGVAAASFLALAIIAVSCKKKPAPAPPPEVQYLTVAPTNVAITQEWIGTLDGLVNADIRAQVSGYLRKQDYAEGTLVKKGDLLFEIDPRPFEAALDQAKAKLAQDQAQLAKTELDVKRFTPLAKEQALSQETLDNAVQANLASKAQVQADEAAVETVRLNLGFTRITSPIDGLAGTALAQIGDLVSPSGLVLTTVSTINPIRVRFQANEQSYLKFWRRFASPGDTNQNLALELILSDGSVLPWKGKFSFADRQVNPTTGTLQIVGLFPNPDFALRPGQYALVRAQTEVKTNAIVVPQRAVTQSQGTYEVAIVGSDNRTKIRPLKLGKQIGSNWLVESGVRPGDRVVVEGTQKAKDGKLVDPKPLAGHAGGELVGASERQGGNGEL
jgi:RND family efflux transporter MFP subunit